MTQEMATDTSIGDVVLVEATLLSGQKSLAYVDGKQVEFLLVRIAGRKGSIAVPADLVYRPTGERYVMTATDFNPNLPKMARAIRRLRHAANMTQYEFSKAVGVAQQTVVNWETGKNGMQMKTASRIASLLNISVSEVLGEAA